MNRIMFYFLYKEDEINYLSSFISQEQNRRGLRNNFLYYIMNSLEISCYDDILIKWKAFFLILK